MVEKNKKKKILKTVIIIIGCILAIGIGVAIYFAQHYKGIIKKNIPVWAAEATDSLYTVTVKGVSINVFSSSITLKNVQIKPDSARLRQLEQQGKAPKIIYNMTIPKIKAVGILWNEYIAQKKLAATSLNIYKPDIIATITNNTGDTTKQKKKEHKVSSVYFGEIFAKNANGRLIVAKTKDTSVVHFINAKVVLDEWKLVPGAGIDTSKFLLSEEGEITIDTLKYLKDGSLYDIKANELHFNSLEERITAKHLSIKQNVSDDEYYRIVGEETDIYNVTFPTVELDGFDWKRLFSNKEICAKALYVNNTKLDIYHSRLPPDNTKSKLGKYPNQLLLKAPVPLNIREVKVNNFEVKYTELNDDTKMAGTITFSKVDGVVKNLTNIPEQIEKHTTCDINLSGKFNKYSDVSAQFILDLANPSGGFHFTGQLKGMEAYQINHTAKALAKAEIRSFHLKELDMDIQGNENYGKGKITVLYNGLKIKLQKKDSETQQLKDKGLLSFVANKVFIYTHNPMPGEEVRHVTTYVDRDIYKSFFSVIWKNIYQGMQKTALRTDEVIDMVNSVPPEPKEKKNNKGIFKKIFGAKDKEKKDGE